MIFCEAVKTVESCQNLTYNQLTNKKERRICMKTLKVTDALLTGVKKMAVQSLKRDANQTTCLGVYQPKAPAALKQFSKVSDDK